jgi:hypothetical protein
MVMSESPKPWYRPDDETLIEMEENVRRQTRVDACLIQNGSFFDAYNESAHVVAVELGFEIFENSWGVRTVGFPTSSRRRNLDRLEAARVSYAVVEQVGDGFNDRKVRAVTRLFRPSHAPEEPVTTEAEERSESVVHRQSMDIFVEALSARARKSGLTLSEERDGNFVLCSQDGEIVRRIPRDSQTSLDWYFTDTAKRLRFPRHGTKWTTGEDQLLTQLFSEGKTVNELAQLHQRAPGGIRSRLTKLGLLDD